MSNQLQEIVDVEITRETSQLSRVGFGTLLAVANNFTSTVGGGAIVGVYGSLAEVITAGFDENDELYDVAAAYFAQNPRPTRLILGQVDEAATITNLNSIQAVNDDWYALYVADDMDTGYQTRMLAVAAWIETQEKIFFAKTRETDTINVVVGSDTDTLAYDLKAAGYDRTALLWANSNAPAASQGWQAAWLGRMLAVDPGSETWKFKTLAGVTPVVLSTAQRANAAAKNVNIYTTVAGIAITSEGVACGGEFLDVMRGIDWLTQQIRENIFLALNRAGKIPYTDAGFAAIENILRGQLRRAQDQGVIAPDELQADGVTITPGFTIVVPRVSATEDADRAARLMTGVTFEARLAGAVHKVAISGRVAP
jgi:hypothetical protein